MWNETEQSKVRVAKMNHLRITSGVRGFNTLKNEEIYERFRISERTRSMKYEVVEWVKRNILRWYGHVK